MYSTHKDAAVDNARDAVTNAKAAGREAKEAGREVLSSDNVRDIANSAGRKVRGFIDNASDEISHVTDTVTTQIRNKPVQASVVSLGIGFLLGALLRR